MKASLSTFKNQNLVKLSTLWTSGCSIISRGGVNNCSHPTLFSGFKTFSNFNCNSFRFQLNTKSLSRLLNSFNFQQVAFIMSAPVPPGIDAVQVAKDNYLNMNLDEKRKVYKCGNRFVTLDNVLSWKEYFTKEQVDPAGVQSKKYEANEELNSKVSMWSGDITALEIDAIVNAANISLHGGSGVDGAIHSAAGRELLNECLTLNGCPEGQAKMSGGYKLPAKYVIHTVGPQGEKPSILRSAYENSLALMVENKLRTIAFPCISTGVYGYPPARAANVAIGVVRKFLENNSDKVDRVIFTVFLEEDKEIYEELMQKFFPLQ